MPFWALPNVEPVGVSDPQVFLSQAGFVCAEMLYVAKNCVQPLQAFTGGQWMTIRSFLGRLFRDVGVSKNRGTPKWMVYNGKPY